MNPGQLRDKIQIFTPSSSSLDRFGQTIVQYATASIWANVKKQSGNEVNANGLIVSEASYIFTIRNRTGVDEKAHIKYDDKRYNVVYVDDFQNEMYLRLTGDRVTS